MLAQLKVGVLTISSATASPYRSTSDDQDPLPAVALKALAGGCGVADYATNPLTNPAGLATELQEADSRKELARVVGRYSRIEVLLLDELGCLAVPDGAAELVFQVISERNERGSLIVTTNLPFGEWTKVFAGIPTVALGPTQVVVLSSRFGEQCTRAGVLTARANAASVRV